MKVGNLLSPTKALSELADGDVFTTLMTNEVYMKVERTRTSHGTDVSAVALASGCLYTFEDNKAVIKRDNARVVFE